MVSDWVLVAGALAQLLLVIVLLLQILQTHQYHGEITRPWIARSDARIDYSNGHPGRFIVTIKNYGTTVAEVGANTVLRDVGNVDESFRETERLSAALRISLVPMQEDQILVDLSTAPAYLGLRIVYSYGPKRWFFAASWPRRRKEVGSLTELFSISARGAVGIVKSRSS